MDLVKIRDFMKTVMASSPSLPAILLAEKAMDHFGFADGSAESATCYDVAFELKARIGLAEAEAEAEDVPEVLSAEEAAQYRDLPPNHMTPTDSESVTELFEKMQA